MSVHETPPVEQSAVECAMAIDERCVMEQEDCHFYPDRAPDGSLISVCTKYSTCPTFRAKGDDAL